jgi:hypothetical protein
MCNAPLSLYRTIQKIRGQALDPTPYPLPKQLREQEQANGLPYSARSAEQEGLAHCSQ